MVLTGYQARVRGGPCSSDPPRAPAASSSWPRKRPASCTTTTSAPSTPARPCCATQQGGPRGPWGGWASRAPEVRREIQGPGRRRAEAAQGAHPVHPTGREDARAVAARGDEPSGTTTSAPSTCYWAWSVRAAGLARRSSSSTPGDLAAVRHGAARLTAGRATDPAPAAGCAAGAGPGTATRSTPRISTNPTSCAPPRRPRSAWTRRRGWPAEPGQLPSPAAGHAGRPGHRRRPRAGRAPVSLDQAREALRDADVTGTSDRGTEEAGRRQMTVRVSATVVTGRGGRPGPARPGPRRPQCARRPGRARRRDPRRPARGGQPGRRLAGAARQPPGHPPPRGHRGQSGRASGRGTAKSLTTRITNKGTRADPALPISAPGGHGTPGKGDQCPRRGSAGGAGRARPGPADCAAPARVSGTAGSGLAVMGQRRGQDGHPEPAAGPAGPAPAGRWPRKPPAAGSRSRAGLFQRGPGAGAARQADQVPAGSSGRLTGVRAGQRVVRSHRGGKRLVGHHLDGDARRRRPGQADQDQVKRPAGQPASNSEELASPKVIVTPGCWWWNLARMSGRLAAVHETIMPAATRPRSRPDSSSTASRTPATAASADLA